MRQASPDDTSSPPSRALALALFLAAGPLLAPPAAAVLRKLRRLGFNGRSEAFLSSVFMDGFLARRA